VDRKETLSPDTLSLQRLSCTASKALVVASNGEQLLVCDVELTGSNLRQEM
jgi:hypothetical protein